MLYHRAKIFCLSMFKLVSYWPVSCQRNRSEKIGGNEYVYFLFFVAKGLVYNCLQVFAKHISYRNLYTRVQIYIFICLMACDIILDNCLNVLLQRLKINFLNRSCSKKISISFHSFLRVYNQWL